MQAVHQSQSNIHLRSHPSLLEYIQDCWDDNIQRSLGILVLVDRNYILQWLFHHNRIWWNRSMTSSKGTLACVWTGWRNLQTESCMLWGEPHRMSLSVKIKIKIIILLEKMHDLFMLKLLILNGHWHHTNSTSRNILP